MTDESINKIEIKGDKTDEFDMYQDKTHYGNIEIKPKEVKLIHNDEQTCKIIINNIHYEIIGSNKIDWYNDKMLLGQ